MYVHGSIKELDGESDLHYRRTGFSLIAIMTGTKITPRKQEQIYMSTKIRNECKCHFVALRITNIKKGNGYVESVLRVRAPFEQCL